MRCSIVYPFVDQDAVPTLVVAEWSTDTRKGSVANGYLADWHSVDIPLQPLRDRGWMEASDRALVALSRGD
jgi:hypothetical protein